MVVYGAESALLRAEKLAMKNGFESTGLIRDMLDVYIYDSACHINKSAKDAINSFVTDADHATMLERIEKFTRVAPVNVKEARRRIANKLIEENQYCY